MNTRRIDLVNIGLMLLSVVVALLLPFRLFLFAYIILGPLHYLTEIGWLKERQFYMPARRDYLWLVGLCFLTGSGYLVLDFFGIPEGVAWAEAFGPERILQVKKMLSSLTFLAFFSALALVLTPKLSYRLLIVGMGIGIALALFNVSFYLVIFGIFIPTLIHTTLFTGAFILQGAMKSKSKVGYLSFVVFVLCSLVFFVVEMNPVSYDIPKAVQQIYLDGEFFHLNYTLYQWLYPGGEVKFVLDSPAGLRIQSFIAFAYTYHYLNWFSKTEVIKWHKIPRSWLIATVIIWLASISLHLYNVRLGIAALIFVSLLHTFLEFPLNHRSFIGIGTEIKKRLPFGKARVLPE